MLLYGGGMGRIQRKELAAPAGTRTEGRGQHAPSDALRDAHILHGNKLCELRQVKDVSDFLTEF